jgi:hypothetical protein
MSDVTWPISTLPGSRHTTPPGMMCDNHQDRPATVRIQGETDSMGCEMWDVCAECAAAMTEAAKAARVGVCDWCKHEADDLREHRDWEEGSCGRLYDVCGACIRKENKRLKDELEEYDW